MSLARHVREGNWSALEDAWTEHILESAAVPPALDAVSAASQRKEIPRCLPLVREHAEMLVGAERADEAARLLGHAILAGGSPGELAQPLYQSARAAWGEEPFWEAYVEIADLRENAADMRASWRAFEKLLAIEPGRVVYHAKGWGLGRIEELDPGAREVAVRFTSGRRDHFPFSSAIEIFEFLDETDLRSLVVTDPEELRRLTVEEPLDVLRWILERNGGRTNQAGIKLAMTGLDVVGPRFGAWWRKAKKEAEASEWFELSGPPSRVQVRLLDVASDPAEGIRRQVARAKNLRQALARVRNLVAGVSAGEEVVAAALEALEELAGDRKAAIADRLGAWIFLREQRGETPEILRATIAEAAAVPAPSDPSQPPTLWALLAGLTGSREQERCIDLLREVLGAGWLDEAARHLPHAPPGMVRGLVDALEHAGRMDELIAHYGALLARATRNPILLVRLGERIETGANDAALAPAAQRAQCLLQLAVYLKRGAPGDAILTRARSRLTALLTVSRTGLPLLERLLAETDADALRRLASLVESGVDRDIDRLFTRIALARAGDVFRGDERPFWETADVWTSRAGLRRREEELRVLRDVKIPANAEAIGKAASFGDLSENAEWEAAIAEQGSLTTRAMELEAEIRAARLIENAAIPPGVVAPGTAVTYRDLDDEGDERRVEIVGPWDVERDDQVSYRSPFATGMLGRRAGESALLRVPSGDHRVEIVSVELL